MHTVPTSRLEKLPVLKNIERDRLQVATGSKGGLAADSGAPFRFKAGGTVR